MKKTEWFPADVKPVHIGTYLTRDNRGAEWLNYWNGIYWSWGCMPEVMAFPSMSAGPCGLQNRQWRGLTEKA